jgi:hypothetical protein
MILYQPAISTELHTLLQLAGLEYEWLYEKTVSYYKNTSDPLKPTIIKEKLGVYYELY